VTPAVALGIRVHSGWGAVVAVCSNGSAVEVLDRRRIAITDPKMPGARQPYHWAMDRDLPTAAKHLADCAAASEALAIDALRDTVEGLRRGGREITGCALLLSSTRPLPALERILASHALIHSAEGEFFRERFRNASEALGIPVTGLVERGLAECAKAAFGKAAERVQQQIAGLGRSIGPPWTTDQKAAALAAAIVLSGRPVAA
jgi:hypothetical protein